MTHMDNDQPRRTALVAEDTIARSMVPHAGDPLQGPLGDEALALRLQEKLDLGERGPQEMVDLKQAPSTQCLDESEESAPTALQDLLRMLKSPSSPQQQQQVLNILKANPQLMADFIKQRTARYQASQGQAQGQPPQQGLQGIQPGLQGMAPMQAGAGVGQRPGLNPPQQQQQQQQAPPQGMGSMGPQGQLMNPGHNRNPQFQEMYRRTLLRQQQAATMQQAHGQFPQQQQ